MGYSVRKTKNSQKIEEGQASEAGGTVRRRYIIRLTNQLRLKINETIGGGNGGRLVPKRIDKVNKVRTMDTGRGYERAALAGDQIAQKYIPRTTSVDSIKRETGKLDIR